MQHGLKLRKKGLQHKRLSFPHTFGIAPQLIDCDFDTGLSNFNQNIPNPVTGESALPEGCTGFTRADIGTNEDHIIFKPGFSYAKTCLIEGVPLGNPVTLENSFVSGEVYGLQAIGETTDEQALAHRRSSPFVVHPTGGQDYFNAVWSAMLLKGSPIAAGSLWYPEMTDVSTVDQVNIRPSDDGHAWEICGVKTTDAPRMKIKWWGGEPKWFGREAINALLSAPGADCLTDVHGKATPQDLQSIGFITALRIALLSFLRQLLASFQVPSGGTTPPVDLWDKLEAEEQFIQEEITNFIHPMPEESVQTPPEPQNASPSVDTLLPWNTTGSLSHENWHNVRVLCDLEKLSHELKEELCATVWGESEFNIHAINKNYSFKADGEKYLSSTDNGICQWNDWFHGAEISPNDAVNSPERAVRLMCQYFLAGKQKQWCAFSGGRYLQFIGKTL